MSDTDRNSYLCHDMVTAYEMIFAMTMDVFLTFTTIKFFYSCIYHIQNDVFDDDGGTIVYVQNNKRTRLNDHQQIIGDSPLFSVGLNLAVCVAMWN